MLTSPLPVDLGPRFSVADARAVGVTQSRLRRADLGQPFHGVRVTSDAVADDTRDRHGGPRGELEQEHLERARRYAPRMRPHEVFSHVTAAIVWDIPLPFTVIIDAALHVAVAAPRRLPRAKGVRGHQVTAAACTFARDPRTGLVVADPATTWAMLASVLKDPYDLVAAGDAVVRTWRVDQPLATITDLESTVRRGRRVGVIALRGALPQIRVGSASRPETRTRLLIVDAGLPEPELNFEIRIGGEYFGAVDLALPGLRIAVEYEGEHHLRDPAQWARDIERYDRLRAAGWIVIQITKADLFNHPGRVVDRVRAAIAARAAR